MRNFYKFGVEPEKTLPRADIIQLEEKDLLAMKRSHQEILRTVKKIGRQLPFEPGSRRIVMTGGRAHLGMAIASVRMLRRVGSDLLVQLFLGSWEDYDNSTREILLPSLDSRSLVSP